MRLVDRVHDELRRLLRPGDVAVDATVGNGHDTLLLAELVGPTGTVYAFDVQAAAIASAQTRVPMPWVHWINAGHETMAEHVRSGPSSVAAVTFNSGYLPGGDHTLTTQKDTTLAALAAASELLKPGGIITLILYCGHPGGAEEADAVEAWMEKLSDCKFERSFHTAENPLQSTPRCVILNKSDQMSSD